MRLSVVTLVICLVAASAVADPFNEGPKNHSRYADRTILIGVGTGFRFECSEAGQAPVADLGIQINVGKPVSLLARISGQPQQKAYYLTNYSVGSLAVGLRFQAPQRKICAFGAIELDETYYHGKNVVYSADSNKIISRFWFSHRKTGIALSGGPTFRLNRFLPLDLGLRLVINGPHSRGDDVLVFPPMTGDYAWPFPYQLYNQSTLYVQFWGHL